MSPLDDFVLLASHEQCLDPLTEWEIFFFSDDSVPKRSKG